jgi:hypothetical protein
MLVVYYFAVAAGCALFAMIYGLTSGGVESPDNVVQAFWNVSAVGMVIIVVCLVMTFMVKNKVVRKEDDREERHNFVERPGHSRCRCGKGGGRSQEPRQASKPHRDDAVRGKRHPEMGAEDRKGQGGAPCRLSRTISSS